MNPRSAAAFVLSCVLASSRLVFLGLIFPTLVPAHVAAQALPDAPGPSHDPQPGGQIEGPREGPLAEDPSVSRGKGAASADTGTSRSDPPRSDAPQLDRTPNPNSESSSEQSRTDLSPPRADDLAHPENGAAGAHEWNPLRAMKDVEVGTFYYNAGNYKAAISRFREALEFKPRDAVATFKLAQALEKSGEVDEARVQYEAYLAILNDGPNAGDARKALARLKKP